MQYIAKLRIQKVQSGPLIKKKACVNIFLKTRINQRQNSCFTDVRISRPRQQYNKGFREELRKTNVDVLA